MLYEVPRKLERPVLPDGLVVRTVLFGDFENITVAEAKGFSASQDEILDAFELGLFARDQYLEDYIMTHTYDLLRIIEDLIDAVRFLPLRNIENLTLGDCLRIVRTAFEHGDFAPMCFEFDEDVGKVDDLTDEISGAFSRRFNELFGGGTIVALPTQLTEDQRNHDKLLLLLDDDDDDDDEMNAESVIRRLTEDFEMDLFSLTPELRIEYSRCGK